jgi:hypothetical protein
MCKVKLARCSGMLLESKPVTYSWFPVQEEPPHILPNSAVIAGPAKIDNMVCITKMDTYDGGKSWKLGSGKYGRRIRRKKFLDKGKIELNIKTQEINPPIYLGRQRKEGCYGQ